MLTIKNQNTESARKDAMIEKYRQERTSLIDEKQGIERRLADLESEKREKSLLIAKQRLRKGSRLIEATLSLEVEFCERRKPLLRDLDAINERLQAMKKFMADKGVFATKSASDNDRQVDVLHRIELLLQRLVDAAEGSANRDEPIRADYSVALVNGSDGSFEVIEQFTAASDAEATAYAEHNYSEDEWFVLDAQGKNINGGDQS